MQCISKNIYRADSSRLLEGIESNFLSQEIGSPIRGHVTLVLMAISASELVDDIEIGGSLCCNDGALMDFTVLGDKGQVKSTVRILNFRKAKFQLFKELVNRPPVGTRE